MTDLITVDSIAAYLTLSAMEIVLGLDNIIFITILVGKLPPREREKARSLGIGLALVTRLGLLLSLKWLMGLTEAWITVAGHPFSGRDLILIGGGLFLVAKATLEIHDKVEGGAAKPTAVKRGGMASLVFQIALIDIVFSIDSVITAVGMSSSLPVMVAAIVTSVIVMLVSASAIGRFVDQHPTIKLLALSFLVLIGVMLVAEGTGRHVEKGYVYFAMAFSVLVEMLNMRFRARTTGKG